MWRYRLWLWRPGWERTYISNEKYVAGETTTGCIIMRVIIFDLIGIVFHGPHGMGLYT
jgi:hypothetical protein